MSRWQRRRSLVAAASVAAVPLVLAAAGPGAAAGAAGGVPGPAGGDLQHSQVAAGARLAAGDTGGDGGNLIGQATQYAQMRTAPGTTVSARAFAAARAAAAALPQAGRAWTQVTDQPYQSDAVNYRDPGSNSSGGYGLVSGRMTALAADGSTLWAGGADGGVWKSTDGGASWTPVFDQQASLSIGAIAVDPQDHSVWVGTGEQNTSQDAYAGDGVYRSADGGRSWQLVGTDLPNSLIGRITFDGHGEVYAATSQGLLRRSAIDLTSPWTTVLKPDPNPTHSPYRTSWFTDVRVAPNSGGRVVVAALGWRGGTLPADTSYNGFYESDRSGVAGSWHRVATTGALGGAARNQIGRTTFSYASPGGLYAVVESTATLGLLGVYRSPTGNLAGPWREVASSATLAKAKNSVIGQFEPPGIQSWYNQYVLVDPTNPSHVYVGLEEIYESTDSGAHWVAISPYWAFGEPCWSLYPSKDTCPAVAHSDQHAAVIANGMFYAGNDGGLYRHPTARATWAGWQSLNRTLHTLQYYYGSVGRWPGGGLAYWGGMQDNGVSLLKPGAGQMVSPEGGDGADNLVDPANAMRAVTSYVYLIALERTSNGGYAPPGKVSYTDISMTCASIGGKRTVTPCEPNPRFIAPFVRDETNVNHWVAGGQYVWDNQGKGWNTICTANGACDWKPVRNLGTGRQTTALGVAGRVIYAGWCGNGCNPGGSAPFVSGIDTNYGGSWHRISAPNLPNRIVSSVYVDPAHPGHVWVTYGAFSRHWIPGAGVGHVFESFNGGATWRDDSGNLPDAPADTVLVDHGQLVVATDVGVFTSPVAHPGEWYRLAHGLPNAAVDDLHATPDGSALVAYTHGRGIWQVAAP